MYKARKALKYSCEVHLQSIYREKEEELHKSSFKIKYYSIISVWQCTMWVRTLQLLRLKTFSNKLCQLCSVCSSEALWCSGGFAQYSGWFQNRIQRNKFSCRVIIAVVPLIALDDRPQAASREGNKSLPWPWLWKCSFPVFVSGLELPGHRFPLSFNMDLSQLSLWLCFPPLHGDHSAGSSLAAGQIFLCFQLQVSGNAGQPAHLRLSLEDKSRMDITAWGGCVTLTAGQVWVLEP